MLSLILAMCLVSSDPIIIKDVEDQTEMRLLDLLLRREALGLGPDHPKMKLLNRQIQLVIDFKHDKAGLLRRKLTVDKKKDNPFLILTNEELMSRRLELLTNKDRASFDQEILRRMEVANRQLLSSYKALLPAKDEASIKQEILRRMK